MFFQISPAKRIKKDPPPSRNVEDEIEVLSLAPFTANPKICFENIPIKKAAVRKIIIKNPMDQDYEITIKSNIPEELNVTFSWSREELKSHTEALLELTWVPITEGSWLFKFTVLNGHKIRRDVPVAFKSIEPNKQKREGCGAKPKYTYTVKKVKTPPVNKIKNRRSPQKKLLPSIVISSGDLSESFKENINPETDRRTTYCKPEGNFFDKQNNYSNFQPEGRSTTICRQNNFILGNNNKENKEAEFEDSLENIDKSFPFSNELKFSNSFQLSPLIPESSLSNFAPEICSTDEKSRESFPQFVAKRIQLFPSSYKKDSTESYIKAIGVTEATDSSLNRFETYVKENENFIFTKIDKPNINTQTYLKENFNSSTLSYIKSLTTSGREAKSIIEADMWSNSQYAMGNSRQRVLLDCDRGMKRKSDTTFNITPPKRPIVSTSQITNFSISQKVVKINKTPCNAVINNPSILTATHCVDPFLSDYFYCTEEWTNQQEDNFKRWLNALLTPPKELNTVENTNVDVAELWKKCTKSSSRDTPLTKEQICNNYSNAKLNVIRKTAKSLFQSAEIVSVLEKVNASIERKKLEIRNDRDLHLDVGLQCQIMTIILSYNPLWLRMGLETIHNEIIPLTSNSDMLGLSKFIFERIFRDPNLLKKHKTIYTAKYTVDIKKFTLKKIFALVYLLDQAKTAKIIAHDPCLFCKNSNIKESREVLIKFARETLQGIGDVTKYLKGLGYVVNYKQSYIEEFDFAVNNLGVHLRDGVRLTRLMEIILLKTNLTTLLRVPAISRLQKIHNMKIVFDSLKECGFELIGDIQPKDLVDGHKEKTLSFLWQIIYKFETPFLVKNVTIIQKWWRSLSIMLKRRKLQRIWIKKQTAATKIQQWYRKQLLIRKIKLYIKLYKAERQHLREESAAIKIQSFLKMLTQRRRFLRIKQSVKSIQYYCRVWLEKRRCIAAVKIQSYFKMYIARKRFRQLKYAVSVIEQHYLANKLMVKQQQYYQQLQYSAKIIQQQFRSKMLTKQIRNDYLKIKWATLVIQRRYRALKAMRDERDRYERIKWAVLIIQQRFRAKLVARDIRKNYQVLRNATLVIQRRFRAKAQAVLIRKQYLEMKDATIIIQRFYRAYKVGTTVRLQYLQLKQATILIQRRYRAKVAVIQTEKNYQNIRKAALIIQRRYRAKVQAISLRKEYLTIKSSIIIIQRYYRAYKIGTTIRMEYLRLRQAVILIQRRFRAQIAMKTESEKFHKLRRVTILIQRRFRGKLATRKLTVEYQKKKHAAVTIQKWYRNKLETISTRNRYLEMRKATITIQRFYRAYKQGVSTRSEFVQLKTMVVNVQNRFRANLEMKKQRKAYLQLKEVVIFIQRTFRGKLKTRAQLLEFKTKKQAATTIQRWYRNKVEAIAVKNRYLEMRIAAITIQRYYKAYRQGVSARGEFIKLKKAVICVQMQFRANREIKKQRKAYLQLREVVIFIQRTFRGKLKTRAQLLEFKTKKQAATTIQRWYRNKVEAISVKNRYLEMRIAAITIQRYYKAYRQGVSTRGEFLKLKKAVICVQMRFRANREMKKQSKAYIQLREAAVFVQKTFRGKLKKRECVFEFQNKKQATVKIQRWYRNKLKTNSVRNRYLELKEAAITLQRLYRAYKQGVSARSEFVQLKTAVICIQRRFRANLEMKKQREAYLQLKDAVVFVQGIFRGKLKTRECVFEFQNKKQAAIRIQKWYRSKIETVPTRNRYLEIRKAAIIIQRSFRAYKQSVLTRNEFMQLKTTVIYVQTRFRANLEMKKQRKNYLQLREAVIFVQRTFRAKLSMRKLILERKKKIRAIKKIQKWYRNALKTKSIIREKSAIIIQKYVRRHLVMKKYGPDYRRNWRILICKTLAATKIQAHWKGFITRKKQAPELEKIRENLRKANLNINTKNTLRWKCQASLEILSSENVTMKELTKTLKDLENMARTCKETCLKLSELLSGRLYILIISSGRSLPDENVIVVATLILIQFAKYERSCSNAFCPQYFNDLLKVMLHWSDKEALVFPQLCTLLWVFAHSTDYKKVMLSIPNFSQMLEKIRNNCIRKEKMVQKKMTINVQSVFANNDHQLPTMNPNWGIELKNRPTTFNNSIFAYKSLKNILYM